ncbi:MAG: hypothetical protein KDJ14_14845 [Xanthomonadales bacterium]|nr:hypothetical protein [Xanthomonadales bacterium]
MSTMIANGLLVLALAASPVSLPPGADLLEAMQMASSSDARYGIDGAPPGPRGAKPHAPETPGAHYLVEYDIDGIIVRRVRFRVAGEAAAPPALRLSVDREGPTISLRATGSTEQGGKHYLGANSSFVAEATDASGVSGAPTLRMNGGVLADPNAPAWPNADGPLSLQVAARDALGNEALSGPFEYWLDRTGPSLAASRVKPREDLDADVVMPGDAIELTLQDQGAGLGTLTIGGQSTTLDPVPRQSLPLTLATADPAYVVVDRLGNATTAELPLRIDGAPPRLVFVADGVEREVTEGTQLPRSHQLDLRAVDEPAGVARACVQLSIWYDECRPLPLSLLGIGAGRYVVTFRATDRLGQRAYARYEVEVLP